MEYIQNVFGMISKEMIVYVVTALLVVFNIMKTIQIINRYKGLYEKVKYNYELNDMTIRLAKENGMSDSYLKCKRMESVKSSLAIISIMAFILAIVIYYYKGINFKWGWWVMEGAVAFFVLLYVINTLKMIIIAKKGLKENIVSGAVAQKKYEAIKNDGKTEAVVFILSAIIIAVLFCVVLK